MTTSMAACMNVIITVLLCLLCPSSHLQATLPIVINTWPFVNATAKAWAVVQNGSSSSVDAVVAGCQICQEQRCDGSVGYGGSPDESGETTLDGMIMDGRTYDAGSVGDLRRVKDVIGVARAVMDYTEHTLLVGESATHFAAEMGFTIESLSTNSSWQMWKEWRNNSCQPNYRKDVLPDPRSNCGPYRPRPGKVREMQRSSAFISHNNHDTIGMVVIDSHGNVAAGTSTNGMNHKVPGRVGDSPIIGAGAYASNEMGGAAATGDGDVMMRFLPSFKAVMLLGQGMAPDQAAREALKPIITYYPDFTGAIIVVDIHGHYGAACHGLDAFHYSLANPEIGNVTVAHTSCI